MKSRPQELAKRFTVNPGQFRDWNHDERLVRLVEQDDAPGY
jgi:hypothetical protein